MPENTQNDLAASGSAGLSDWTPPAIDVSSVTTGDMPGDKVQINQSHIEKANAIFPHLLRELERSTDRRLVVSVYGGSGVGKSEIAAVLGWYFTQRGFDPYVLSGDNYPHRVPEHNDLERLSVYRNAALNAFAADPTFTNSQMEHLRGLWAEMADMRPDMRTTDAAAWTSVYYDAGREALTRYLGTERESSFSTLNRIIAGFKEGSDSLNLKRMGRSADDIRFEAVDFTGVRVLIIEWTHGNNPLLLGVDFPVFLFSTPAETLAHRLARARDKNADSPLISLVLEIEQEKLIGQADDAALIISKSGEVLSVSELRRRLTEE